MVEAAAGRVGLAGQQLELERFSVHSHQAHLQLVPFLAGIPTSWHPSSFLPRNPAGQSTAMLAWHLARSSGRPDHEARPDRGLSYVTTGRGESWLVDSSRRLGGAGTWSCPGAATAVLAFLAGGFFAVTTGRRRGGALPAARRSRDPIRAAVRRVESCARGDGRRAGPVRGLDAALRGLVGLAGAGARRVRSRAAVPPHAGVRRAARARPGAACRAAALGRRWRSRSRARSPSLTRLLPATFPTKAGVNNERLAFPLTYWNAMGMFMRARRGASPTHLTASEREPAAVRVAAAAALPIVAVTLYFTFSRGGIAVAIVGIVALHDPGASARSGWRAARRRASRWRSRCNAPTAPSCSRAYDYAGADARAQGRSLLVVVIACVAGRGGAALAGAAARPAAGARAGRRAHAHDRVRRRRRRGAARARGRDVGVRPPRPDRRAARARSCEGNTPPGGADLRSRLTEVGNNGRLAIWRVALDEAEREPVARRRGRHVPARVGARAAGAAGARRRRRTRSTTRCGPSSGWIGIALLLVVFAVPLGVARQPAAGARAARPRGLPGRRRSRCSLHAMVDWDWEMPALFVWFFGAAGAVLAAPAAAAARAAAPRAADARARGPRGPALAVTPLTVAVSQSRLEPRASTRCARGDCATATTPRSTASTRCSSQAEAFEVLGWCDARAGQQQARGRGDAQRPAARPRQLALRLRAGGRAGAGGRGSAARPRRCALRLNPLDPLTRALERAAAVGQRGAPAGGRGASSTIPFG